MATRSRRELEERTIRFAKMCRDFYGDLPRCPANEVYGRQLIRCSSSAGANYLESDNALSKKDAIMRLRIAVKESRETAYWLQLIETEGHAKLAPRKEGLLDKSQQLSRILASIMWMLIGPRRERK